MSRWMFPNRITKLLEVKLKMSSDESAAALAELAGIMPRILDALNTMEQDLAGITSVMGRIEGILEEIRDGVKHP